MRALTRHSFSDVTKAIRPAQTNYLAVRVRNPGNEPIDGTVLAETPHFDKAVNHTNGNLHDYGSIIERGNCS